PTAGIPRRQPDVPPPPATARRASEGVGSDRNSRSHRDAPVNPSRGAAVLAEYPPGTESIAPDPPRAWADAARSGAGSSRSHPGFHPPDRRSLRGSPPPRSNGNGEYQSSFA